MDAWARSRTIAWACALLLAGLLAPPRVAAQGRTYHYQYQEALSERTEIRSLDNGLFGDAISYVDGGVNFRVTDVDLAQGPGPALQFARRMTPARTLDAGLVGSAALDDQILGQLWQVEVPALRGIYPNPSGFLSGKPARCSSGSLAPPPVRTYPYNTLQSIVFAYNFWHGLTLSLPGANDEKLQVLASGAATPADGRTWRYQTLAGARVACLDALQNGEGEGFLVVTPDGLRYHFDWMATHKERGLPVGDGSLVGSTVIARAAVTFHATRVEDRFGNTVTYQYDAAHPYRVIRMASSAGAAIDIHYDAAGRIDSVEADGRRWRYAYTPEPRSPATAWLTRVELPDRSAWHYAYPGYAFGYHPQMGSFGNRCKFDAGAMTSAGEGTLGGFQATHPSGARGDFAFKAIVHGYNNVPHGDCTMVAGATAVYRLMSGRPKATPLSTLVRKTISGPGMTPVTWTLAYAPSWSYASECRKGCASSSITTVSRSDGVIERYEFGNDYQANAHLLLRHTVEQGDKVLRTERYTYVADAAGQPFPDTAAGAAGEELGNSLDNPLLRKHRPQRRRVIEQDGVRYQQDVLSFDAQARPLRIESGPPG